LESSTANIDQGYTQPILRWAGSKKSVLTKLENHLPDDFSRYIELFAGSACLFFKILPESAIISDNNRELTNFYKVFSMNFSEVYELFVSIPRKPDEYYKIREKFKSESNCIRRAAFFLYLNRNCFNGIYRTNLNGHFNVPFSSNRIAGYPTEEALKSAALSLKAAKVVCGDFEHVCRTSIKEGDFVYMDPPYYVPNKRVFKEYSDKPFCEEDFYRLSELLSFIDERHAKFMLSYPDCLLSREIAKKWNSSRISVKRIIGGTQKSRSGKYELIIKNY
jgi:DNA adenine methylase